MDTEMLIARLVEEDLRMLEATRAAEKMQLAAILSESRDGGHDEAMSPSPPLSDTDAVVEAFANECRVNVDAIVAQSIVGREANLAGDWQLAQKLAASEKKFALDSEFARRLHQQETDGLIDANEFKDAESLLSKDEIARIMAADVNSKGKGKEEVAEGVSLNGKGRAVAVNEDMSDDDSPEQNKEPQCGICLETLQITYSPVTAAQNATSSNRLPFGLRMPCPGGHTYCLGCITHYIRSKIDPQEEGIASIEKVVFPIRCPECPQELWPQGIQDDVAERILTEKGMLLWHTQKLLDSIPRFYCPNPKCSALVQIHDDPDEPQAICPSCRQTLCVECRVRWHKGYTCEEYQAIPPDERSPEDQLLLQLAKAKNWRRCPNCKTIVELTIGCNHITCRCGTHFCFRCGSLWKRGQGRNSGHCTRNPPCDLWDEANLLDAQERERAAALRAAQNAQVCQRRPTSIRGAGSWSPVFSRQKQQVAFAGAAQARPAQPAHAFDVRQPPPAEVGAAPPPYQYRAPDADVLCSRHWFTRDMVENLRCGYCNALLNSLRDLQYHLEHVTHHSVYACCGRFFKRGVDFERHQEAYPSRFGVHDYSYSYEP
ncbi:hypothetical protein FISHEDRAFT_53809 [Fistulina hepatica ATCC 64428]|uniref:RBR-type E3 ubiquitin transferase n=1 Tax=Fistulina hepatica ATCC 64428 TaxID=1128425 RepID=A0A0D7A0I5_9AGAR|nr:hypothetical protein FISHEDRAFT_53809 [Fistulina hepatica ATCC 64428]